MLEMDVEDQRSLLILLMHLSLKVLPGKLITRMNERQFKVHVLEPEEREFLAFNKF